MEYVKINNSKDILKIGLRDMDDKPILDEKGEAVYWQFDLADIELPLKWSKLEYQHNQNQKDIRAKFMMIDKKEDVKGKYLLSKNEEERVKAINEYYKKEEELLDTLLGSGGTKKFLNGRNYYWDMFEDINEALVPILPLFEKTFVGIEERIKNKYKETEKNVME